MEFDKKVVLKCMRTLIISKFSIATRGVSTELINITKVY
jgi:hypothetical protein